MQEKEHSILWPNADRLLFRKVERRWRTDMLLDQKGWFPLPDVMRSLDPKNTGKYRRILAIRDKMLRGRENPQAVMGLRQFGSRIWAEMPVFSSWFRENESLRVNRVPKTWDLQTFLSQRQGIFSLRGVLGLMPTGWPIKYPAMKNMIAKSESPREEMGADKLDGAGYVVFMPEFGDWIKDQIT